MGDELKMQWGGIVGIVCVCENVFILTQGGLNKMVAIMQKTISNAVFNNVSV